ncbi:hypothetical protein [Phormidium sp. CCY1219]|uniref:hypothetical protein n=1 Tax=Phormidium sp. CCY1219 TaxID=2886104 RepID=UPI002D1F7213|nr:hypothetical protein [Phormidium sp. CCY1219]MEB3830562.1 hypothetical protein [Phormidium sp. CCY1219]
MVNDFREAGNDLVPVDYSFFLQQICSALQGRNPFRQSRNGQRLLVDIDSIAQELVQLTNVPNPLASTRGVRSATINFSQGFRQQFPDRIQQIADVLRAHLHSEIGSDEAIAEFLEQLITDLQSFQGNATQLGWTYNFTQPSQTLEKQALHLQSDRPGGESLLKFHKLTISVRNLHQFQSQLQQGIENYINTEIAPDSETDAEELCDILSGLVGDELSQFHQLQEVVDTETLGKLKKEAKITYLKHLRDNIETNDTQGLIYLQDLIRRLELIEEYISDPDKSDADYDVNYGGVQVNYKSIFSRAEALDALPIIPLIVGNLAEYNDRNNSGNCDFIFGLKLKLGGPVQTHEGEDVFDYNLNAIIHPDKREHIDALLDEDRRETFARKVLARLFLYYFIFASRCNPNDPDYNVENELLYNPINGFDAQVMRVLRGNDEEAKRNIFRGLIRGMHQFNVRVKIQHLRDLLKSFLRRQTILPLGIYPRHICIKQGILNRDPDSLFNGYFLNEVLERNRKEVLRYISIEEPQVNEAALCQIPVTIKIEDVRYFPEETREQFSWSYDIDRMRMLAIAWVPDSAPCMEAYNNHLRQNKLILFRYNNTRLNPNHLDSTQAFIYRFTWMLLAYMCLHVLLEYAPENVFIPMLRLHQGTHENPFPAEKFIANLSKTISHLLSDKYLSSSQGFRIRSLNRHRVQNGLNSLYSVLPKRFRFQQTSAPLQLDKLAIIVVSSRESDARYSNQNRYQRLATLIGEAIGVQRLTSGEIKIERLTTFSDNCSLRQLYSHPAVLIDTVSQLYRQGYHHFLYVAQAPHTSTLHITRSDRDEELYFMSPRLIETLMKNHDAIKIYPIFFDKYYVRKLHNPRVNSLVVQDTRELTTLAEDPQQQAVVFFNLFNGISVGQGDDRFYNGVISYSTLLGNFYSGVMEDRDIRQDLIYDTALKQDILQYLTLFHFSRFERQHQQSLKLDPYQQIIGEESFGALSIFEQMTPRVDFNSLAFLTQVKKVLNLSAS